MVDPIWSWDPAVLRRIGVGFLVLGVSVLTAHVFELEAGLPRQPAVVVALALGASAFFALIRNQTYADATLVVGFVVAVGFPVAVVLRLFVDMLTIS